MEAALETGRSVGHGPRPEATVARELILRGASAIRADASADASDDWGRILAEKYGARPARRSLTDVLDEIEPLPMDPDDPYRASRILEELRAERLP